METPQLTPDTAVLLELGPLTLNATIAFTWLLMGLLIVPAWFITRRLTPEAEASRPQMLLEAAVGYTRQQVGEIAGSRTDLVLPFSGTLVLFIGLANVLAIVPGWQPPTASLSTTAALAIVVFFAVPAYGIAIVGVGTYLRHYIEPTPIMLPFRIISELSRTLALAVRLFGNMMSGEMVVAILLLVVPLLFPVLLEALGLLTGVIQAYI
ncbi:MAG: F0F1 ATP synthase subunit A, partial [Candidatus Limnocylindrales bacterium]